MTCFKCQSPRVAMISAKCYDCCYVQLRDSQHDGYVPDDIGIGGGDYVKFSWCLDCGAVQGKFPLKQTEMECPPDN
jgi:hypothetical protein